MKALTLSMVCKVVGKQKALVMLPADRNRYAAMLAKLGEGETLQARFNQQRDTKHNSKLHGVCAEVADAIGWETLEFKDYIVTELRPDGECPITGHVFRKKTREMSDQEIDELVTEIKAWTTHHMPGFQFQFDAQYKGVAA